MKLCLGCMKEIQDDQMICPHCGYKQNSFVEEAYYLTPGTILGDRYLVGKVLGYGGFGVTYIGRDLVLKRTVAIKEFFPSAYATRGLGNKRLTVYSGDANEQFQKGLESFISEAKRLAQFNHVDGIVRIYDCIRENDTGYIIMEYLSGKTVKELLDRQNRLPYSEARDIAIRVLQVLAEVHKSGIIHRDIAPDNIFITDNNEVKLLDFGAARYAISSQSKTLSVILKPGYAPEEQYRSHGEQGAWTDIYGLGASFYRMITGIRPEESIERMVEDHLKPPSELGVKIPPKQERALMKSLSVRKENRFQNVEEFLSALTDNPSQEGVKQPSSSTAEENHLPKKGHLKQFVAAGACIIAAAIGIYFVGIRSVIHQRSEILDEENRIDTGTGIINESEEERQSAVESPAEGENHFETEPKAESEGRSETESTAESERESEAGMTAADESRSETEPATESERRSEAESTAESERQSEAESTAESSRQSEAESTAESDRQSEAESAAESSRQSEAESTAESERQSEAESAAESERQSEAESAAESERQSEAESTAESSRQSEAESTAESERQSEAESAAESERQSEAESTAESERQSEAESAAESERQSEAVSTAESERQSEAESAAESERQSEAESMAESERQSEAESMAESERQSEAESMAESERQSEAESTAESERQSEAESAAESEKQSQKKRETYKALITEGEQSWKISIHNDTDYSVKDIQIRESAASPENVVFSEDIAALDGTMRFSVEEGKLYDILLTGTPPDKTLIYYSLDLSEIKAIWLREEDGYAYAVYRENESNRKVDMHPYAVRTLKDEQTRYIISTTLNVRTLPDTSNKNNIIKTLKLGDEVHIIGEAKGLIDGNVTDWFLIRTENEYGYISAKSDYTTDDKEVVDKMLETDAPPQPIYIPPNPVPQPTPRPNPRPNPPASNDDASSGGIDWVYGGIRLE